MTQAPVRTIRRAAVFTHNRPDETAEAIRLLTEGAGRTGVELVFESDEHARRRPTSASCSAGTARPCARCATTPAPACRSSRSTTGASGSSPRSTARSSPRALELALTGQFEVVQMPALLTDGHRTERFRDQRGVLPAAAAHERHPPLLLARRRVGRARALRRVDRRDAGRLDRLQPLGRRPDRCLGREGVRREPDRPARAQLARAGGRARGRAAGGQRRRRADRHRDRRDRGTGSCRVARRARSPSSPTWAAWRSCRARASTAASARSCCS